MGGLIIGATIVAALRLRNNHLEKAVVIKAGKILQDQQDKPAKLAQIDRDARSTVKLTKARVNANSQTLQHDIAIPTFGYKNYVTIAKHHGFIDNYTATPSASVYDGHSRSIF